jgi:cysteine-rich repeat protein
MSINTISITIIAFAAVLTSSACDQTNQNISSSPSHQQAVEETPSPIEHLSLDGENPSYYVGYGIEDDFDGPLIGMPVPYSVCGNGIVEPAEQCDDGNDDNQDGCNVICLFPICGNGLVEEFEECDNYGQDTTGCTKDCLYIRCGNKIVETANGEQCDDGNHKSGDGCSACCKFEKCGNDVIDPKEECDDGNNENGDGCSDCCKLETTKTQS